MLPFLKDRHEGGMSSPVERKTLHTLPDEDSDEYGMLDAIAEDLIDAIHAKDKKILKAALEALCEYIEERDEEQDEADFDESDEENDE